MKLTPELIESRRARWRAVYHKYKVKNLETHRATAMRSHWKHRDKKIAAMKAWNAAHPYSSWSEAKKAIKREKWRNWYHANIEQQRAIHREKTKARYAENPRRFLEYNRKWAIKNPEKKLEISQRRRARKFHSTVNPETIATWMTKVKSKKAARCYYCDKVFSTEQIHFDHIKPLSKGGVHSVENICVSCPTCNLKKGSSLSFNKTKPGQTLLEI